MRRTKRCRRSRRSDSSLRRASERARCSNKRSFAVPIESRARCQSSEVGSIFFFFTLASDELDDQIQLSVHAHYERAEVLNDGQQLEELGRRLLFSRHSPIVAGVSFANKMSIKNKADSTRGSTRLRDSGLRGLCLLEDELAVLRVHPNCVALLEFVFEKAKAAEAAVA